MELRKALEGVLDEWEERDYLGMSQIWDCPLRLYRGLVYGRRPPGRTGLLYCHEGYVHQRDVLERLERAGIVVSDQERELVAPFDDRFRGHIDGVVGGRLLEIKSVNRRGFEWVMRHGARDRHVDQVQAYLRYGGWGEAAIVYKCRDDGDLWVVEVGRDEGLGDLVEEKARGVLGAVDRGEPPGCECGRCR